MLARILLDKATAVGTGPVVQMEAPINIQAWIEGASGSVSASVRIWGSNDAACLITKTGCARNLLAATTTLSGTGLGGGVAIATDQGAINTQYAYYWVEVTAISGTGAKVSMIGIGK